MDSLPIEITLLIASWISLREDVARMCLVSSAWLKAARPILYRRYVLRYASSTLRVTLNMLNNNEDIKKSITALIVVGPSRIQHFSLTPYDVQGMVNIRTAYILKFSGFPRQFIQDLVGKIYQAAPQIEGIHFLGGHDYDWSKLPMVALPSITPVLKEVCLKCDHSSVDLLKTTFLHNPSAITKLDLSATLSNITMLQLLATVKFPALETFKIFLLSQRTAEVSVLFKFLAAHPSIQKCRLAELNGISAHPSTPSNILPNLQSLSANLRVFQALGDLSPSLHCISSLELLDTLMHPQDISVFEQAARRIGGLTQLRHFQIKQVMARDILLFLGSLEHLSPNLERFSHPQEILHWASFQRRGENTTRLSEALNKFHRMQTLDLHAASGLSPAEISYITTRSPTIQRVQFFGATRPDIVDKVLERVGDPKHSVEFRTIDMTLTRVWWEDDKYRHPLSQET